MHNRHSRARRPLAFPGIQVWGFPTRIERIALTSILLPARDHRATVIPAQGDRCTTVIPAQAGIQRLGVPHEDRKNRPHLDPSPSERPLPHRHSRAGGNPAFGGSPRGSKESPSPRFSPIERPLPHRHSRAGGNPAFGGSPRGSKESPSPRSFSHRETIAQPSFPRRRESRFGGSPRGSKESPSPRFSPSERPSRNRHSRARRPLHNRHSRAGGKVDSHFKCNTWSRIISAGVL